MTRIISLSIYTLNLLFIVLMLGLLTQCGGSASHSNASDTADEATDTAAAAYLVQSSVNTAATAVYATTDEPEADVSALMYAEDSEDYYFVLSSETRDCFTEGTFYIDADNNLISFDECVNTIAGSTLTADGDLTVEITETGMTVESDVEVEMEWANGEYGKITQLGIFTSELADNISTVDFEDFDGEVTCAGETIAYYVDGFIDYDLDTDLMDGKISVTYDGISTDCTFEDFDLENATAAEWYAACGGLSF